MLSRSWEQGAALWIRAAPYYLVVTLDRSDILDLGSAVDPSIVQGMSDHVVRTPSFNSA